MKTLFVENLVHRGTVAAEGFLFSAALLPEREIRRRVLSLWQTGATVFRADDSVLLQFAQPVPVDCRRAVASPLVRYDKIMAAFPLSKSDLKTFAAANETLVFLENGTIRRIEIKNLKIENVETWFDVANFQTIETETLGEIKTRPVVAQKIVEVNLREKLKGAVPPADDEMNEILRILRQKKAANQKSKTASPIGNQIFANNSSANASFSNLFAAASLFAGAFGSFRSLFGDKNAASQFGSSEPAKSSNLSNKARRLLTRALFQMRVAQIFGRKQAKYLTEMMEMFERGDIEEALKHAIPLEDMQTLRELTEQTPFLGFLRARGDLRIQTGRERPSNSAVFLGDDWFAQLRQTYRQTFERLVAQNKIEEAAFVLAELLKSNDEAVAFLEKHGKLRLAAELAEARNLPKETVVRQWFIAGEPGRAVRLAVLHNCFEYVVTKLEKENHPQSPELRELWADNLAASGNLPAAVNTIWKLENRRDKAKNWIDRVIEFGGVPAAQMLIKKIALVPESFPEVKEKLFEFLSETGLEAAEKQIALAREITVQTQTPELRLLARPIVRQLAADWATTKLRFTAGEFHQLVQATNDFALRADLPNLPAKTKAAFSDQPFSLEISGQDAGANPIFDACLLPDGKTAIALGEAGVKILSRDNKIIAHFDFPTQKFVVSDSGTTAVGLMRRGETHRLTRFDFVHRRASYWCDQAFTAFAPTFDGNLWFVGLNNTVYAIDRNAADFEAVWSVSDIGGNIYDIARTKSKLVLLIKLGGGIEKWSYDLPNLTLRSRNQVKGWYENENENQTLNNLSASVAHSVALKLELVENNEPRYDVEVYDYETRVAKFRLANDVINAGKPLIIEDHYAVASRVSGATVIALYKVPNRLIATFRLCDSAPDHAPLLASAKLDEKFLTVTDQAGRIIVFDYRETVLRKNLRH